MPFDPLDLQSWLLIGVAVLCGAIVGLERELRGKPIGMRTCVLICLGTTIFVRVGLGLTGEHGDSTRVVGQVVTGVGFLGAGVILARGEMVTGVTTASVVWLIAAIGTLIGVGNFLGATVVSLVAVAILVGFEWIENAIARRRSRGKV